ncbi:MAG: DnaB-like helicase C-terminal domain-containing protein [Ardenticatenaceae bacterium]|nr:DnaB-like helicase C-terminal domain-containing protein [Ardenticatenaceae bacterium]
MTFQTSGYDKRKRAQLRSLMIQHFDMQDIKDLCFDLRIDFENLGAGSNKNEKVRALILFMENRLELNQLVEVTKSVRPQVEWPSFPGLEPEDVSFEKNKVDLEVLEATFGIQTGFTDLDGVIGVLHNGSLNIVASRPGLGKSSLVTTITMVATMRYEKRVAFFSLQMSNKHLQNRIISSEARIEYQRLIRRNFHEFELPIFMEAIGRLAESQLIIVDDAFLTPMAIRDMCHKIYNDKGLDLIVIDGIELIQSHTHYPTIFEEKNEIARYLKNLARELNIPILLTSQVSVQVEERFARQPLLNDLPGDIGQFADTVIFIKREEDSVDRSMIAEIQLVKHRDGHEGYINLYWDTKLMTFKNLQRLEVNL